MRAHKQAFTFTIRIMVRMNSKIKTMVKLGEENKYFILSRPPCAHESSYACPLQNYR